MFDFAQPYFEWPTLPATLLLGGVLVYWLTVIVGAIDLDFLDFDLEIGLDGHESMLDWGMVGLKWFNIGEVPFMVWLSGFALPAWLVSALFDRGLADPTAGDIAVACLRNAAIGLFAAKILTSPLKGHLKLSEPYPVEEMIGRRVVISTADATPEFGQAQYSTGDGAPLQLHVRSLGGLIPRGTLVEVVDYSPEKRLYYVQAVDPPPPATS